LAPGSGACGGDVSVRVASLPLQKTRTPPARTRTGASDMAGICAALAFLFALAVFAQPVEARIEPVPAAWSHR
jgi:hypothetical protein